jgi:putative transposase
MQIRTSPAGSSLLAFAGGISKPEVLNTDPGVPFTCLDFTGRLEQEEIRIRLDGRGRVFDNIFVERLWRTVKYPEGYLNHYQTIPEARSGSAKYFLF